MCGMTSCHKIHFSFRRIYFWWSFLQLVFSKWCLCRRDASDLSCCLWLLQRWLGWSFLCLLVGGVWVSPPTLLLAVFSCVILCYTCIVCKEPTRRLMVYIILHTLFPRLTWVIIEVIIFPVALEYQYFGIELTLPAQNSYSLTLSICTIQLPN